MKNLEHCRKGYTADQDKALHPRETVRMAKERFSRYGDTILLRSERIDTGRLDIPVFLSVCGSEARRIMPARQQMGKGASPDQAEASALMELAERFSLFSFKTRTDPFAELTWTEAEERFGPGLLPLEEILKSVHENLEPNRAKAILDLVRWRFCPAFRPGEPNPVQIPFDWFYTLNEFNGSSAGNTLEEAILQGGCELIERHVCAVIDRDKPFLPTINPRGADDPVLQRLLAAYTDKGMYLLLKDFSLDLGVPTVGALAYDPATFPERSEIVFTAGTATSPQKAAIRALTEVAQLAGDFETGSCYDPSGLSKFATIQECGWLESGPVISLTDLPDTSHEDFLSEIHRLRQCLASKGYSLYSIDTTHPDLDIPASYSFVPGFFFRERTARASLGLFVSRILAEQSSLEQAAHGLSVLEDLQPGAFYLPFFRGLLRLRTGELETALQELRRAESLQPSPEEQGLVAFYAGYALFQMEKWPAALQYLDRAVELSPDVHAYYNLRGVTSFKLRNYQDAARDFDQALHLDGGSAVDLANLGLCHMHLGNRDEAVSFLQASLARDPDIEFARSALQDLLSSCRIHEE